tara:strand:+ start:99 stop:581 length:483 start_codon:yes stop_codon:yes gene_type:complete
MVDTTTITEKGLSIKVADGDFTLVSILADIDMRTGTPVDETAWLDGNSGGSYPGTLTGFNAKNVDGKANGSLRMVTLSLNVVQAAIDALVFSAGASKILGIVGYASATAAKDITVTMTNTGLTGADDTVAPLSTDGLLPSLLIGSESVNQVVQITVLLLN